jgi:hypothetical protein
MRLAEERFATGGLAHGVDLRFAFSELPQRVISIRAVKLFDELLFDFWTVALRRLVVSDFIDSDV